MTRTDSVDIDRLFREGTEIDAAMNAAVREAVLQHKRKGLPLVVWRDGKVAWIRPEEIDLGPDFPSMPATHEG